MKRMKEYSQWMVFTSFEFARYLNVITCRLDRQRVEVCPAKSFQNIVALIVRLIIVMAYWDVVLTVYPDFVTKPRNFMQMFTVQQIIIVAVYSTALFVMKVQDERSLLGLINRLIRMNETIKGFTNSDDIFCKQFFILASLKTGITLLGYINEFPALLNIETLTINKWLGIVIGVYLWLGCMFVLDACYFGFLIISLMYVNLGNYLHMIVNKMQTIETGNHEGSSLTPFYRMKLLCDYSEKLDDIGVIYSRLYNISVDFAYIFQWHIFYYIYYNFMVIFVLLLHCIWHYNQYSYLDFMEIFFIMVKISNLALLIMCANYAVEKSEMPNQLSLDVICSDIDIRWDISVETFLSQRKVENLEIKVLGFFTLNNQFILLILSAIVSYIFLIIQFGMSGGFVFINIAEQQTEKTKH